MEDTLLKNIKERIGGKRDKVLQEMRTRLTEPRTASLKVLQSRQRKFKRNEKRT